MNSIFGIISIRNDTCTEHFWGDSSHFLDTLDAAVRHIKLRGGESKIFTRWVGKFTVGSRDVELVREDGMSIIVHTLKSPFLLENS